MSDKSPLSDNSARVWFATPGDYASDSDVKSLLSWLSAEERQRYARFHFDRDRQQFLVAHAMLRDVLSGHMGLAADRLRFTVLENGRPEIDASQNPGRLRFSLSHTRKLVCCVLTRRIACGIDVEGIAPRSRTDRIAGRMYSPFEQAQLDTLSGGERDRRFFQLWTLKEAFVKAMGIGLSWQVSDYSFDIKADQSGVAVSLPAEFDDSRWQFDLLAPNAEHVAAVALQADGAGSRLGVDARWWSGAAGQ